MTTLELRGTVRNGAVILDKSVMLPDGTQVRIVPLTPPEREPGEAQPGGEHMSAEFAEWDAAGNEAWAMIDDWEQAERP